MGRIVSGAELGEHGIRIKRPHNITREHDPGWTEVRQTLLVVPRLDLEDSMPVAGEARVIAIGGSGALQTLVADIAPGVQAANFHVLLMVHRVPVPTGNFRIVGYAIGDRGTLQANIESL